MRRALLALVLTVPLAACGSNSTGSGGSGEPASQSEATASAAVSPQCPPAGGTHTRTTSFTSAPPMCIDPAKKYTATVTTDAGEFTIDLLADKAPKTVNNFVFLARNHFYDGITFHRVIKGFMAQGGDPEGTGSGGPGYEFDDELPKAGEYKVGSVAMANAGPNTNGSQFFVITGDSGVQLRPDYSLFGQVSQGMQTVQAIEADGSESDGPPARTHTITSVTVSEQ